MLLVSVVANSGFELPEIERPTFAADHTRLCSAGLFSAVSCEGGLNRGGGRGPTFSTIFYGIFLQAFAHEVDMISQHV
jgi:hypothetical protein